MAAFLGTILLGVEIGLGIAIGLALLLVVYQSAFPHMAVLGQLPDSSALPPLWCTYLTTRTQRCRSACTCGLYRVHLHGHQLAGVHPHSETGIDWCSPLCSSALNGACSACEDQWGKFSASVCTALRQCAACALPPHALLSRPVCSSTAPACTHRHADDSGACGAEVYRNVKQYPLAVQQPHMLIVRVDAPIYFANVEWIRGRIEKYTARLAAKACPTRLHFVILDLSPVAFMDSTGTLSCQLMMMM